MHLRISSISISRINKSFLILFLFLWCGTQQLVDASDVEREELKQPKIANISHLTTMSHLDQIVEDWGRKVSRGKGFRWVEMYRGTKNYPNAKVSILYQDTHYYYKEQSNKKTLRYDVYGQFTDHRLYDNDTTMPVIYNQGLEMSYRWAITKGLNAALSLNATLPNLPIGGNVTLGVSFSSTKEGISKATNAVSLSLPVVIPKNTAVSTGFTISREEYEFPFTSNLCLNGDIVLCTKKTIHINNNQGNQPSQKKNTQENFESQATDQKIITLTKEEAETLEEIEKEYKHFPEVQNNEELEKIKEAIKKIYLSKVSSDQDILTLKETESGELGASEPRAIAWYKKFFGSYKFELVPIVTVIKQYFNFDENRNHPDRQDYIINEDEEEVIFKARGIIKAAHEINVVGGIRSIYHETQYPTKEYSLEKLLEIDSKFKQQQS